MALLAERAEARYLEHRSLGVRWAISRTVWEWYEDHKNDEVLKVTALFGLVKVSVRVYHLKGLLEGLFGDKP
jgi:hypothetical protein